MTNHPHVQAEPAAIRRELEAFKEQVSGWDQKYTAEQFYWSPDGKRWSVGACLNHLCQTANPLLPKMDKAIQQAKSAGKTGTPPFRLKLRDRLFIRSLSPDSGMKLPSPKMYQPVVTSSDDPQKVVREFITLQDHLLEKLNSADGLDFRAVMIPSPVSSLLRLSLAGWFLSTIAHQKRHLGQAEQMSNRDGFTG